MCGDTDAHYRKGRTCFRNKHYRRKQKSVPFIARPALGIEAVWQRLQALFTKARRQIIAETPLTKKTYYFCEIILVTILFYGNKTRNIKSVI